MDKLEIEYALAKQVPDMARGFTIATSYGELHVGAVDAPCRDEGGPRSTRE
ncbi:hypothetical protein [Pseudomonas aeruginosa]|uniref:hypothetical protein n=1 Tax=Pseudomonas aeruginosa TaxID=287 RepID=UPI00141A1C8C|nr:hypothetical protein [Pseudomonas aeruginosa]